MPGDPARPSDDELLREQQDFSEAGARSFDAWIGSQIDPDNEDENARTSREGRQVFAAAMADAAPLGRVLEIAAGTGRVVDGGDVRHDRLRHLAPPPLSRFDRFWARRAGEGGPR